MKKGRKSAYEEKIKPRLEEIKSWCLAGHIDKDMFKALGVSEATFYKHKAENREFSEALKVTKDIADLNVVNSLYKRALGYDYDEITRKPKVIKDEDGQSTGKTELAVVKTVSKQVLPDVTAQIFWLKNRTKEWTDRKTDKEDSEQPAPTKIEIIVEDGRITNTED